MAVTKVGLVGHVLQAFMLLQTQLSLAIPMIIIILVLLMSRMGLQTHKTNQQCHRRQQPTGHIRHGKNTLRSQNKKNETTNGTH